MSYVKKEEAKILLEFAVTDKWSLEYARKRFELDLPSADVVERKKGKWILHHDGFGHIYWTCSGCDFKGACNYTITNFCSNCGADMREK